ncbi:MAG: GNAT family N-acetyltransferase [Planctomycetota bacterium]
MVEIERIQPGHAYYEGECRLREEVLLAGAGYTFESFVKYYPHEDQAEHFVAVIDHPTSGKAVIGCALLRPNDPEEGVGKVTQVAVHPQRQGEGIGLKLMTAIEARAFGELGHRELYCHAQNTAVEFYKKLGWGVASEEFMEAGIPHHKMAIRSGEPRE